MILVNPKNVTIKWKFIPYKARSGIIRSYKLTVWNKNLRWSYFIRESNGYKSKLITNLKPYTEYKFSVAGVNRKGYGINSTENSFRTMESGTVM